MRLLSIVAGLVIGISSVSAAEELVRLTPPGEKVTEVHQQLGQLEKYIGSYDYDGVLNEPVVNKNLHLIFGNEFDHLINNLNVHSPLGFTGQRLVLQGNRVHGGGEEEAILFVWPNGDVEGAIFSNGTTHIYSSAKKYNHLESDFRNWIFYHQFDWRLYTRMPPNVDWKNHNEE